MPVSIETLTLEDWPAATVKLLGSAELQPMNWQLERVSKYDPGARDASSNPDTLHPSESQERGSVSA